MISQTQLCGEIIALAGELTVDVRDFFSQAGDQILSHKAQWDGGIEEAGVLRLCQEQDVGEVRQGAKNTVCYQDYRCSPLFG